MKHLMNIVVFKIPILNGNIEYGFLYVGTYKDIIARSAVISDVLC